MYQPPADPLTIGLCYQYSVLVDGYHRAAALSVRKDPLINVARLEAALEKHYSLRRILRSVVLSIYITSTNA